jgi:orotate phosphoribosyltransferase-like protein
VINRRKQIHPPVARDVEIRWREENDPRRLRRIAEILANILDSAGTPEDGRRS